MLAGQAAEHRPRDVPTVAAVATGHGCDGTPAAPAAEAATTTAAATEGTPNAGGLTPLQTQMQAAAVAAGHTELIAVARAAEAVEGVVHVKAGEAPGQATSSSESGTSYDKLYAIQQEGLGVCVGEPARKAADAAGKMQTQATPPAVAQEELPAEVVVPDAVGGGSIGPSLHRAQSPHMGGGMRDVAGSACRRLAGGPPEVAGAPPKRRGVRPLPQTFGFIASNAPGAAAAKAWAADAAAARAEKEASDAANAPPGARRIVEAPLRGRNPLLGGWHDAARWPSIDMRWPTIFPPATLDIMQSALGMAGLLLGRTGQARRAEVVAACCAEAGEPQKAAAARAAAAAAQVVAASCASFGPWPQYCRLGPEKMYEVYEKTMHWIWAMCEAEATKVATAVAAAAVSTSFSDRSEQAADEAALAAVERLSRASSASALGFAGPGPWPPPAVDGE